MIAPAIRGTPRACIFVTRGPVTVARIAPTATGIVIVDVSASSHVRPTKRTATPTRNQARSPRSRTQIGAEKTRESELASIWTIVGTSKAAGTYRGREAFLANVIRPFGARVATPLVPTVRALYADGDVVIALFDAVATAKDGRSYRNTYSWYLRVRDGRIVGATAFFDTATFDDLWTRITP